MYHRDRTLHLKQAHPLASSCSVADQYRSRKSRLAYLDPKSYSKQLSDEAWRVLHTSGSPKIPRRASSAVLDDKEYLEQSRKCLPRRRRIFDAEFPKFRDGMFFFYFSSLDLNSHMFWRLMDPSTLDMTRSRGAKCECHRVVLPPDRRSSGRGVPRA